MRSHDLAHLLLSRPDLPVTVSVDLSTENEETHGHRAFGHLYTVNPDAAEVVLCAESGYLNFTPPSPSR